MSQESEFAASVDSRVKDLEQALAAVKHSFEKAREERDEWRQRTKDALAAASEAIAAAEEAAAALDGWMNRDKVLTKDTLVGGLWMSTIANAFLHMLDTSKDAKNYVESRLEARDGRVIVVTVQRAEGKSPADLVVEARGERDALQADLRRATEERNEARESRRAMEFELKLLRDEPAERRLAAVISERDAALADCEALRKRFDAEHRDHDGALSALNMAESERASLQAQLAALAAEHGSAAKVAEAKVSRLAGALRDVMWPADRLASRLLEADMCRADVDRLFDALVAARPVLAEVTP